MASRPPQTDPILRRIDAATYDDFLRDEFPDYVAGEIAESADQMDRESEIWRFDDTVLAVCRMAVSERAGTIEVVALYPQLSGALPLLRGLLQAAVLETSRRFPMAGRWPVRGTFPPGVAGLLKAQTWAQLRPGSPAPTFLDRQGRNIVEVATLRELVRIVSAWP